jgi:hypothetical protein
VRSIHLACPAHDSREWSSCRSAGEISPKAARLAKRLALPPFGGVAVVTGGRNVSAMQPVRIDPAARDALTAARFEQLTHRPAYHFEFQQFHISNTRAVDDDHDSVSFVLRIADQPARVLNKHMGDVDNGDHPVQLKIGPVTLPETGLVHLVTTVINSGHQDEASLDDALTTAANEAIDLALDEIPGGELIEIFTHWLVNLFAVNCDGVVIGQRWTWPVHELKEILDRHNPWTITHTYHGTDTSVGCGSNSEYTGTWLIRRTDT